MTPLPQITFRNMEPVPILETSILKEISVLERFFQRIMSCRVVIEGPRGGRYGGLHKVRIDLGVPNEKLFVEQSPSLHGTLKDIEAPARPRNRSRIASTGMRAVRSMTHFKKCAAACRTR